MIFSRGILLKLLGCKRRVDSIPNLDFCNGLFEWYLMLPYAKRIIPCANVTCRMFVSNYVCGVASTNSPPQPINSLQGPLPNLEIVFVEIVFWDSPRISQILSAFCLLNCLVVADSRFGFPFAWLCCNAWFWCKQLKLSHVRSDHFGLRGLELLMCGQESPYDLRDTVDAGTWERVVWLAKDGLCHAWKFQYLNNRIIKS